MSITTYSELKTAVAAWLNRTDLTSVIPDFVTMAESDIRIDVRCKSMEEIATGSLTGETLAHPTGYIEAKMLYVDSATYVYVTPDRYYTLGEDATDKVFTSIGDSFYIKGATTQDYTLIYYKAFDAFSGASDTNWLLTNYPDVYLSGACRHGAHYLKDYDEESRWAARYAGNVARLTTQQMKSSQAGQLRVVAS